MSEARETRNCSACGTPVRFDVGWAAWVAVNYREILCAGTRDSVHVV